MVTVTCKIVKSGDAVCPADKNLLCHPCSKGKYERTYHSHSKNNLRLFTKTPRNSEKWKIIYNRRTSIERSNKREKIDYKLDSGRHRSTKMFADLKLLIFPQSA